MSGAFVIAVEGGDPRIPIQALEAQIIVAERQAVNKAADRARTNAARFIREQVAFPASYLSPAAGRLAVTKRASDADLSAIITGRQRPTSLARFANSTSPEASRKAGGVSVTVAPGHAVFMRGAFLLRLKGANSNVETLGNLALAIRIKKGSTMHNKKNMTQLSHNVFILYGPSVDQVFKTVAEDIGPDTKDFLEREFMRLLKLGN